jgi:hypothetical protein
MAEMNGHPAPWKAACAYVAITHLVGAVFQVAVLLNSAAWNGATSASWVPFAFASVAWFGGVRGWRGDLSGGRICILALAAQSVGWCAEVGSYLWITGPAVTLQWSATTLRLHMGWETSVLMGFSRCEVRTLWVNFAPPLLLGAWALRARYRTNPAQQARLQAPSADIA